MNTTEVDATRRWTDTPDHFEGIGRLVTAYTNVELTVKSVLYNLLNLPEIEFNILLEFGRIKTSDMPTVIARIASSRVEADPERKAELLSALNDFERLSQRRNQLVHWLWIGGGEVPQLINLKPRSKPAAEAPLKEVPIEELKQVTDELITINALLCDFLRGAAEPYSLKATPD